MQPEADNRYNFNDETSAATVDVNVQPVSHLYTFHMLKNSFSINYFFPDLNR